MTSRTIKQVEAATLKTFTEEIPSIYFSDKTEAEFETYSHNAEITYRDLLKFPPKMFQGADLIDFGAGTGENTVSLARWGANCTLVEMNANAIAISKKVFSKYAPNSAAKFVQSSIFDFDSNLKFDIVHCRGVWIAVHGALHRSQTPSPQPLGGIHGEWPRAQRVGRN